MEVTEHGIIEIIPVKVDEAVVEYAKMIIDPFSKHFAILCWLPMQ
jgi:hypothetical protein